MPLTGAKTGQIQSLANCAGISANTLLTFTGSAAPTWAITAPAAVSGTISGGTFTSGTTETYAGTEKVAVFWTVAGVNYYRYDCTISAGTGTTFTISSGTGTTLPTGGQAIYVAVNQDITDGISLTGNNVQQLLVTSTQIGLVEWLKSSGPTQERLSYVASANGYDVWPAAAGASAPPTGGAGANWTGADVVDTLRCWNFSTSTATIQVALLLA